jgi:hypothetical protein
VHAQPIGRLTHLFVTRRTAPRLIPVGRLFPWQKTNVKPRALREDRILQEIHATGGDMRRICDLFDLKVDTAMRYAALGHSDQTTRPPARQMAASSTEASPRCLSIGPLVVRVVGGAADLGLAQPDERTEEKEEASCPSRRFC